MAADERMEPFHMCAVRRRMFDYIEAHPDRSSDDLGAMAWQDVAEAVIEQGINAAIERQTNPRNAAGRPRAAR